MLKIYVAIALTLISCVSFSQESQFVFRNSDRPSFDKLITVSELSDKLAEGSFLLLDVRLKEDFDKDPTLILGATRVDPEQLPEWSASLSVDSEVVVYCVAGKWVSQKVAYLLNEQGIRVSSLAGGIEAWKESERQ